MPDPTAHPLKLLGVPGSPYSRKLRAVLLGGPDCTPSYYNNEGQDGGLRAKLNVGYPAGATAYFRYLDEWCRSGAFEGLEFHAA